MKKLFIVLFGLAMILAPFAELTEARGGRGRASRGISGKTTSRTGRSKKDQVREREQTRSEERDSLVGGKLRRRGR